MAERFLLFVMVTRRPVVGASVEFIRRWIFFSPITRCCSLRRCLRQFALAATGVPFAHFDVVDGLVRRPVVD